MRIHSILILCILLTSCGTEKSARESSPTQNATNDPEVVIQPCRTTLVGENLGNTLTTTAVARVGGDFLSCEIEIPLIPLSGKVCSRHNDDDSQSVMVLELQLEDVPLTECDLGLLTANVSIREFGIINDGNEYNVTVPAIGGSMTGNLGFRTVGVLTTDTGGGPKEEPLELVGTLPLGEVSFGDNSDVTFSFSNTDHQLASMPLEGLPLDLSGELILVDLNGSATFTH